MNEREQAMMEVAMRRLEPFVRELQLTGWLPEVVAFAPEEIPRIEGYKVAVVLPLRTEPARPAVAGPPEHLREDAPYVVCSGCGRRSYGQASGEPCLMTQPDGSTCRGTFRVRPEREFTEDEARRVARAYAGVYVDDEAPLDDGRNAAYHDRCFERAVAIVDAEEASRREEHERLEQEAEDEERWREQALRDPGSDAYHSDGAREARIDAGLEKP